jgi:CheY-like chemotaxis protein
VSVEVSRTAVSVEAQYDARIMQPQARRRVLVVDDEPPVAAMLNDVPTTWGYAVQVAATGPDAISVVPGFRPDVVHLDMALPRIPANWSSTAFARPTPTCPSS